MKKLAKLLMASALLLFLAVPAFKTLAADTNLIANPSVETAAGTAPADWTADKWGTNNATLEYKSEGHTGDKSLYVSMSSYTSGDAKWMADPVSVTENTSYTYTSYYKSNVDTELDVQYADASGKYTYAYVQTVPASTDWRKLETKFTTPAGATKAVMLHIVFSAGWLQTDDFSLVKTADIPTPPPAADGNMLANPSMETANGAQPADWFPDEWGNNSANFNYSNDAHDGSKSVNVQVSQYTSGDAKWFAKPVVVTAGQTYTYADFYKSTVGTRVVAAYQNAAGDYTYLDLPDVSQSTNWKEYRADFTVPDNMVSVSIYHLIDKVGSLTLDEASIRPAGTPTPDPNPTPDPDSYITNNSLEEADANGQPTSWQHNAWGNNSASFQYVNDGHTGQHSAKVTIGNYVDGDAKWYFAPISTLKNGGQYRFTTWYKTNVTPHAVMMWLTADGAEHFFGMPNPFPAGNSNTTWTKYTDTFIVPKDAVAVSAFLFINQNGWLQVDDQSLDTYQPVSFSEPMVTLTFDDSEEDNVTTVLPLTQQLGFKFTQCFATTFIEGNQKQVNRVLQFKKAGEEICGHTVTHPFLTQLSQSKLTYELQHSQQYLQKITGEPIDMFASPYGDYNQQVNNEIKKYYKAHRTVDEGYNSKDNLNPYRLRVQNMLSTTTQEEFQSWLDQAKADHTWLIVVYHRVANDPEQYDTTPAKFQQQMAALKASGMKVLTLSAGLKAAQSQL